MSTIYENFIALSKKYTELGEENERLREALAADGLVSEYMEQIAVCLSHYPNEDGLLHGCDYGIEPCQECKLKPLGLAVRSLIDGEG